MLTIDHIKKDCAKVIKSYNSSIKHQNVLNIIAKALGYKAFGKMKNIYTIDDVTGEIKEPMKNYPFTEKQVDISKGLDFNVKVLKDELNIDDREADRLKVALDSISKNE